MNRYKVIKSDFAKVRKYLSKNGATKTQTPSWGVKFKDRLSVVNGKIKFDGLTIIPDSEKSTYLRKLLYDGDKIPFSRDSAFHHIKKEAVGISRRYLMDWLRGQSINEMGRAAVPGHQKGKGGAPISSYVMEFDLIFVRRPDLEKVQKRFKKADLQDVPFESYIVSVSEKSTGITALGFTKTKDMRIVTPKVIAQIKRICKTLGVDPKKVATSSDKGGEFHIPSILKIVKSHKVEKLAPSIEQKNRSIQKQMFNVLRSMKTFDLQDAIKRSETLVNNTYNKINKRTPLESAELAESTTTGNYNKARKKGLPGRHLQVGDWVRILIKDKKAGIGYKSYKSETFSAKVFQITSQTKNIPHKFRVNKKWRLSQHLLKSKPVDTVSQKLVRDREEKQDALDDAAQSKLIDANKARLAADIARAEKKDRAPKVVPKKGKPKLSRLAKFAAETAASLGDVPSMRRGARKTRRRMIKSQEREAQLDKTIGL